MERAHKLTWRDLRVRVPHRLSFSSPLYEALKARDLGAGDVSRALETVDGLEEALVNLFVVLVAPLPKHRQIAALVVVRQILIQLLVGELCCDPARWVHRDRPSTLAKARCQRNVGLCARRHESRGGTRRRSSLAWSATRKQRHEQETRKRRELQDVHVTPLPVGWNDPSVVAELAETDLRPSE